MYTVWKLHHNYKGQVTRQEVVKANVCDGEASQIIEDEEEKLAPDVQHITFISFLSTTLLPWGSDDNPSNAECPF